MIPNGCALFRPEGSSEWLSVGSVDSARPVIPEMFQAPSHERHIRVKSIMAKFRESDEFVDVTDKFDIREGVTIHFLTEDEASSWDARYPPENVL